MWAGGGSLEHGNENMLLGNDGTRQKGPESLDNLQREDVHSLITYLSAPTFTGEKYSPSISFRTLSYGLCQNFRINENFGSIWGNRIYTQRFSETALSVFPWPLLSNAPPHLDLFPGR